MTAPTQKVRAATYLRDLHRCVSCGTSEGLTWQHRAATGMGGAGKRAAVLTPADGLTACAVCNMRFESDLQEIALASGWKLRRHRGGIPASELPYRDAVTGLWWLPDVEGYRHQVTVVEAMRRLRGAGSVAS